MAKYTDLWWLEVVHNSCRIDIFVRKTCEEINGLKAMMQGLYPKAKITLDLRKTKIKD